MFLNLYSVWDIKLPESYFGFNCWSTCSQVLIDGITTKSESLYTILSLLVDTIYKIMCLESMDVEHQLLGCFLPVAGDHVG